MASQITAAPPARDICDVVAGDHLAITFPLTDAEGGDVDVSGYTAAAEIRGLSSGRRAVLSAVVGVSEVRLDVAPAITAGFDRRSRYDIRLADAAGAERITVARGLLLTLPAITT